jgi:hypothetical protein
VWVRVIIPAFAAKKGIKRLRTTILKNIRTENGTVTTTVRIREYAPKTKAIKKQNLVMVRRRVQHGQFVKIVALCLAIPWATRLRLTFPIKMQLA